MKGINMQFMGLFGVCCIGVIIFVITLLFLSEKFAGAGDYQTQISVENTDAEANNRKVYLDVFEKLRNEYSNVKTVELEADVKIDIVKDDSVIKGNGNIKYLAEDNKYKYSCEVSKNLEKAGLMRNVGVLYDGNKFYFFDSESKIISFQNNEETRNPCALPNPFLLPVEFFSSDDDTCEGCKMRLQDLKMPQRWAERANSMSVIMTDDNEVGIHRLIKMKGGKLNNTPYNYQVRFVGETMETMQPVSIARVKEDGRQVVGVVLNDLKKVEGINVKIPHSIGIAASDDTGRVVLNAVFNIKKLKVNQPATNNLFEPNFDGAERFWDSDAKTFVNK